MIRHTLVRVNFFLAIGRKPETVLRMKTYTLTITKEDLELAWSKGREPVCVNCLVSVAISRQEGSIVPVAYSFLYQWEYCSISENTPIRKLMDRYNVSIDIKDKETISAFLPQTFVINGREYDRNPARIG